MDGFEIIAGDERQERRLGVSLDDEASERTRVVDSRSRRRLRTSCSMAQIVCHRPVGGSTGAR